MTIYYTSDKKKLRTWAKDEVGMSDKQLKEFEYLVFVSNYSARDAAEEIIQNEEKSNTLKYVIIFLVLAAIILLLILFIIMKFNKKPKINNSNFNNNLNNV